MLVAPFGAHVVTCPCPHATQTFGLCAMGLPQVKAVGLVQASGLLISLFPYAKMSTQPATRLKPVMVHEPSTPHESVSPHALASPM